MALKVYIEDVDRTSLLRAKTLNLHLGSDQRNSCSLTIQTTAATFLPVVGQDLVIKDETTDGEGEPVVEVLFGGVIRSAPHVRETVAAGANSTIFVNISSDGYNSIPSRRTLITDYVNETAGSIVTSIVTDFLSEEGVTAGTISTGATVSRYKRRVVSIKEILDDLAKLSGFKWWIDDSKALHFTQEATITAAAHDVIEGGEYEEFGEVTLEEQLENYRNKQFIKGGVLDDGSTYTYLLEDTAEQARRAAIEGGTGVHGNVFEDSNIVNDTDGAIVAANLLKRYGRIPTVLTFRSFDTDWRAGTKLKVNLPTFGLATDTWFLIDSVTITDLGAGVLRSEVSAYRRQSEDEGEGGEGADDEFSTQRDEDYIDYFADLVAKAKEGAANEGNAVVFLVDKNAGAVELTATPQRVLTKTFSLIDERTVMVDVVAQLTCQANQLITAQVYLDDALIYTWKDYFYIAAGVADSKNHLFDVSFPILEATAGQRRISVFMSTSTSTADIAAGGAVLTIAQRGVLAAAAILVEVGESVAVPDMPSAPVPVLAVGSGAAKTIGESATVPDMATVADSLLVVYERHQTGDDSYLDAYGTNFEAQTFRVGVAHTCDTLMLKCLRVGSPGTATVGLYAVPTATLTTSLAGDDNDLVYTANGSGAAGNDITVAYIDPEGASQSLSVVVTDTDIVVNLATDGEGDITTTAGDIITAIEADEDADALVSVANAAANDGTGVVTAMAETALAGGANTPTGAALATQTFDGDTITDAAAGERVYVTIAGQSLTAGTMYAIVLSAASGDASNLVRWRNDSTSPAYTSGGRAYSSDSGSSWAADATRDYIFEEGDQQ